MLLNRMDRILDRMEKWSYILLGYGSISFSLAIGFILGVCVTLITLFSIPIR